MSEALPFDTLETPLTLVERLEAYEPKSYLMSFVRLDAAGIDTKLVKKALGDYPLEITWITWSLWKSTICAVTGKTWLECAEMIYGERF